MSRREDSRESGRRRTESRRDNSRESGGRRTDDRYRRDERRRDPSPVTTRRRDDSRGSSRRRSDRRHEPSPGRDRRRGDQGNYDRRDDGDRRRRSRSRGRDESPMALVLAASRRNKRSPKKDQGSGFDQKTVLPEDFAMSQLVASRGPPMQNPGGMGKEQGPPPNTVPNPEVELFLLHNPVEPHCSQRLRALPVDLQEKVMHSFCVFGVRNPTAVLLTRIREATTGTNQGTGATQGTGMSGNGGGYGQSTTTFSGSPMAPGGTGTLGMTQPPGSVPPAQSTGWSAPQQAQFQAPQSSADMAKMWAEMNRGQNQSDSGSWNAGY